MHQMHRLRRIHSHVPFETIHTNILFFVVVLVCVRFFCVCVFAPHISLDGCFLLDNRTNIKLFSDTGTESCAND